MQQLLKHFGFRAVQNQIEKRRKFQNQRQFRRQIRSGFPEQLEQRRLLTIDVPILEDALWADSLDVSHDEIGPSTHTTRMEHATDFESAPGLEFAPGLDFSNLSISATDGQVF